jgi:uncharacterized protein YhaN
MPSFWSGSWKGPTPPHETLRMKIDRLRIPALGPLRDLDTGEAPLPGFVVVTGPNEAGKSSLLEAVRIVLHGIYPASRADHPMAPWDGTEAQVMAQLTAADGTSLEVHRRILASPWGRLRTGEHEEDLRNRTLPQAAHVPRDVYRQVHAVSLPELMTLQQGEAWKMIRDRIMAGMGTRDLAPPRTVADALDREADRIWRATRQGKSRDRELGEAVTRRSEELRSSRDADQAFRRARGALDESGTALARLRIEQSRLREALRQARELAPLEGRLRYLDEQASRAGDPAELRALEPEPRAKLRALGAEAAEAERMRLEREAEFTRAMEGVPAQVPAHEALLEGAAGIEALRIEAVAGDAARDRALGLAAELEQARESLFDTAEPILHRAPDAGIEEALARLSTDGLRGILAEQTRNRDRTRTVEAEVGGGPDARSTAAPDPGGVAVATLVGLAALLVLAGLWGLASGGVGSLPGWAALAAGTVLCGVAGWRFLAWRDARQQRASRADREARRARELDDLRRAGERLREELRARLEGIPVREARLDMGGEGLATALERIRDAGRQVARLEKGLAEERGRVDAVRSAIRGEGARLGVPVDLPATPPDPAPSGLLAPLLAALGEASSAREAQLRSLEARARAEQARDQARQEAARLQTELEDYRSRLVTVAHLPASADDDAILSRVEARLEAASEATRLRRELERVHGPLAELRPRVEAALEHSLVAEGGLAEAEARLEALDREVERLVAEEASHAAFLEQMAGHETADLVESDLQQLREARERGRSERDRRWILARAVRVAERTFRELHQPELVRRAEATLAALTRGRYTGLIVGDDEDPDALQVRGGELEGPQPVARPLSTGTREQIWFALRLAVVDLVEGGGEPLPLVLDEVLVNWDAERRAAALEALADQAQRRQVFLVTCHPAFAREAESRGARLVELDGPPAPGET